MPFLAKQHTPIPEQDLLSWFFDSPLYDLNKPVLVDCSDPSRVVTGLQARTLIRQLAAGLRAHGLQKDDCVVVGSFNDIYYPILALGIIAAGGVFSGHNPSYTSFEIGHHLNTVHASFVICEPDLLQRTLDYKHEIPKERIFMFDTIGQPIPEGFKGWKTLLEYGEAEWPRFTTPNESKTTNAMLLFSSGTTGLPKAVQLTHYNLIAEHTLTAEVHSKPFEIRRLLPLPFFHAASTPSIMLGPFRIGATTYVMRRFELEPYMRNIERFRITDLLFVPPMAVAIVMSPLSKQLNLTSIRAAIVGAAPLDREIQARMQALFAKDTPFTQVWGMTETSCIAAMFPWPEADETGSIGRFVHNMDVKLVNDEGRDVSKPDTRGELCVRGPIVTRGYFENEEANRRDFDEDGYFHTGDIVYMDGKTGLWYIVDRKKELIKVRGFQVAPPEIEGVLLSHPSIVDVAVIGVQAPSSSRDGELPRAYVVQRPGTPKLSEQEVVEFAGKRLAGYKRLTGGVKFLDEIPKTASGKILKRMLRDMVAKEGLRKARL